jgi:hypothetical protein
MALLGPQAKLLKERTWQMDTEESGSLHDPLQSVTHSREHVPMAEREARANRFVSLLVGDTEKPKPSPSSNRALPLLRAMIRKNQLERQWAEDQLFKEQ